MDRPDAQKYAFRAQHEDQRKFRRFPASYQAMLGDSGSGIQVGTVVDISREGCRIRCAEVVPPAQYFKVEIRLDGRHDKLTVDLAVMRWSREQEIGIEFIRMAPENQARLRLLIQCCEEHASLQDEHRLPVSDGFSADSPAV